MRIIRGGGNLLQSRTGEGPIRIKGFIYGVEPREDIAIDEIGMNALQRQALGLALGQTIDAIIVRDAKLLPLREVSIEISPIMKKNTAFTSNLLEKCVLDSLKGCPIRTGSYAIINVKDSVFRAKVTSAIIDGESIGLVTTSTLLKIKLIEGLEARKTPKRIDVDEFKNPSKLGIGGMDHKMKELLTRAFSTRRMDPELAEELGVKHVKGILLYGPPGTGKTLIARRIGELLRCKSVRIINGPELTDKYIGETERHIRDMFSSAEEDEAQGKDGIHLVILDEIDAMFKSRGGFHSHSDGWVNQLLTKMDGVKSPSNILLIGLTNRKDLIDPALLRPGRFEVHLEIGLPDHQGLKNILNIHTKKLSEKGIVTFTEKDIDSIASSMTGFSGAEVEGAVRRALSSAIARNPESPKISLDDMVSAV